MTNRELAIALNRASIGLPPERWIDVWTEMIDAHMGANATVTATQIAGYTAQSDAKVDAVNQNKVLEERLLRVLDGYADGVPPAINFPSAPALDIDKRWLSIARTHFQEGFMALNRAVFQPQRIRLPEDDE